jgi:hypothetical protein
VIPDYQDYKNQIMNRNLFIFLILLTSCDRHDVVVTDSIFCTHKVVLDDEGKIIPWFNPRENAYDNFIKLRWDFIKKRVPLSPGPDPRSRFPQYYFYCAFRNNNGILEPDTWMNDIGEKIPNWFENARLYYAYTGDKSVMTLIEDFVDYVLVHGTSPETFAWPGFPYTTTNAGDTVFRGFTSAGRFALHEIQVDHAGEMGLTYYRMYLFSSEEKYLIASLNVANVLASKIGEGNREKSIWPYRVAMDNGLITAPYGANWTGCYMLFDNLIRDSIGNVNEYIEVRERIRNFLLQYPLRTGCWTDGHTDTDIKSNTYKSNLSANNMALCMFDYPDLDPEWERDIPLLIKWTEDNFVFRTAPGEPSNMWGANIVGEQDTFNYKMDYQTARYAAVCARWYNVSRDESYREKAYRSLNWVTYCNDSLGMAYESPVSKGILSWWSDCYGECPRMFYHVFAAVPEWAPPGENHILYSEGILREVSYSKKSVKYTAAQPGTEYLRLSFKPLYVTINGKLIPKNINLVTDTYSIRSLGKGDYAITIKHSKNCEVILSRGSHKNEFNKASII